MEDLIFYEQSESIKQFFKNATKESIIYIALDPGEVERLLDKNSKWNNGLKCN